MNKILIIVFSAVIAASVITSGALFFLGGGSSDITVVETPAQTQAERPDVIPDPEANMVKLPEGANIAEGKPLRAGEVTDVYAANNANDGEVTTYWESRGFPAEITIDLENEYNVQTVAVRLNPSALWEARVQTFEVSASSDGENFTVVVPETPHGFDPGTGNTVRLDFSAVKARYIRFTFTATTAGRTGGAQAAEIEVYE